MSQTNHSDTDEQHLNAEIPVGRFRQYINAINGIVDEGKLRFDQDGLQIKAVDPANVAMIEGRLYDTAFSFYDVSEGVIGVNIRRLAKLLELAPDESTVQIQLTEFKKYKIHVGNFEWTEGWIGPDSIRWEPDLPDLDLTAEFTVPGDELNQAVEYAQFIRDGTHSVFEFDDSKTAFTVSTQGKTADGEYRIGPADGLEVNRYGYARSTYSNDYLRDCMAGVPDGVNVTLELGEEFPYKMHYPIEEGQVEALQAPRIQSD